MKVLFLSNLYPNVAEPTRAVFNKQKVACLKKLCEVVVVAPVQWFPLKSLFDKEMKNIPLRETIDGVDVHHPRVFYFPKFFRAAYGIFFYLSIRSFIRALQKDFKFDIILSSWVYPDGFAAMRLAGMTGKPFVAEALGSDINIYCGTFFRRRIITGILKKADGVITVSKDIKNKIVALGIPEKKVSVVYSGIDHDLFFPRDKEEARRRLGIAHGGKIILFAGNIVKVKGIRFLLRALKMYGADGWKLYMIGSGSLDRMSRQIVGSPGLREKVVMAGKVPYETVPLWMNASDVLCLPSLAEGVPNVVLEAFACGVPVVASRVGGVPEVVVDEGFGCLVEPMDVRGLADGIDEALDRGWDKDNMRKHALKFSWDLTAQKIFDRLSSCMRER